MQTKKTLKKLLHKKFCNHSNNSYHHKSCSKLPAFKS